MFKCYRNISVSFQGWAFSFGGIICNPINFIQQPSWKKFQLNCKLILWLFQCCYPLRHSRPLLKRDLSLSKFPAQSGLGFKPYCSQPGARKYQVVQNSHSSPVQGARRKSGCNYDVGKCQENERQNQSLLPRRWGRPGRRADPCRSIGQAHLTLTEQASQVSEPLTLCLGDLFQANFRKPWISSSSDLAPL